MLTLPLSLQSLYPTRVKMTIDQARSETNLEESICPHLRTSRTIPKSTPPGYNPPFPAFSSRFTEQENELVMIVLGVQSHQGSLSDDILDDVIKFINHSLVKHWDLCSFRDFWDKENRCVIAYWNSRDDFEEWKEYSGFISFWDKEIIQNSTKDTEHGWYLEQFMPSLDRFETVFSDSKAQEGFSTMESGRSGQIEEHAYWGSMRDRIPKAQTDSLLGITLDKPSLEDDSTGYSITKGLCIIKPHQNLCVIRSGQDFKSLKGKEREMYLQDIHPTLIKGMKFLRDQGNQVNCFDCRFMQHISPQDLEPSFDKTFGLAYFNNLTDLESWAKQHPTHLDIFGRFLRYADQLKGDVNLRLFHDVMVLSPEQQSFQYVNCHNATGMMAKVKSNHMRK